MSSASNNGFGFQEILFYKLPAEFRELPILKPLNKYKLQDAIGLKDQKQRWLSYLEMMRECIYEKNVNFEESYRKQKNIVTSQIVRTFKKKAPDFPPTAADWAIKEMLVNTIQRKRYYLSKKQERPSPAPQGSSPVAPQGSSPVALRGSSPVAPQDSPPSSRETSPAPRRVPPAPRRVPPAPRDPSPVPIVAKKKRGRTNNENQPPPASRDPSPAVPVITKKKGKTNNENQPVSSRSKLQRKAKNN